MGRRAFGRAAAEAQAGRAEQIGLAGATPLAERPRPLEPELQGLVADRSRAEAQRTTKEVRRVPAEPHETTIGQRPGVVRVPTFHVQETRPFRGRFG